MSCFPHTEFFFIVLMEFFQFHVDDVKTMKCSVFRLNMSFHLMKDGVVLGADTRATSSEVVADKMCAKIHYIAPNI